MLSLLRQHPKNDTVVDLQGTLEVVSGPSPSSREGVQTVGKTMGSGVKLPSFLLCALEQVA